MVGWYGPYDIVPQHSTAFCNGSWGDNLDHDCAKATKMYGMPFGVVGGVEAIIKKGNARSMHRCG